LPFWEGHSISADGYTRLNLTSALFYEHR
jgi:hypothetical protein